MLTHVSYITNLHSNGICFKTKSKLSYPANYISSDFTSYDTSIFCLMQNKYHKTTVHVFLMLLSPLVDD